MPEPLPSTLTFRREQWLGGDVQREIRAEIHDKEPVAIFPTFG